ncbi:MAG: SpaH/EbpB family LPXTG-anchored major pilin [Oscillospiraceae bacterium]|nr:SpaH/EbpB family LPXTG-anchored major pilin [Oscillospiraceae bacterium]
MKTEKKARLLAILLAVLLGASMFAPLMAQAAPPDDGGKLTIHKFIMKDLRDALDPNDGNVLDGTRQAQLDALIAAGKAAPLGGVVFKVYKLDLSSFITSTSAPVDNPNPTDGPWGSLGANPDWEDIIKAFESVAFSLDNYLEPTKIALTSATGAAGTLYNFALVMEAGKAKVFDEVTTSLTAPVGVVTTKQLEKGFYLVVEQPGPVVGSNGCVASMSFPFIAAVPMTNPTGDGWIENVNCYPKNGDINTEKSVDRNAVYVGEKKTWTINVSVPQDIMHYEQFFLTDVLDDALNFVPGSLKIYALPEKDALNSAGRMIPVGSAPIPNYRESHNAATNELMVEFIVGIFGKDSLGRDTASYTVDGRNWLFGDFNGDGKIAAEDNEFVIKYIRFEFETTVNEKILDRLHASYALNNKADINFRHRYDNTGRKRESNGIDLHTAALIFNKINAHTGAQLPGAGFQIATTDAKARAGQFLRRVQHWVCLGKTLAGAEIYRQVWSILDVDDANGYTSSVGSFTFTGGVPNADGTLPAGVTAVPTAALTYAANGIVWEEFSVLHDADPASTSVAQDSLLPPTMKNDYNFTGWPDFTAKAANKAIVRFEGIKEFNGNFTDPKGNEDYRSYYIVETKAPESFNLLLDPIRITYSATVSTEENWYTLDGGAVNNTNTFILPRTGGTGTILFTAGGISLIGVAAVLLLLGARRKKAKG